MYFKNSTPEKVGIKSNNVKAFLKALNEAGIAMHSVLLARGDKLFCEAYWAPNKAEENHRMYSQTKSYVGIAIAQLAEEGVINLDDKIIDYFPEKLPEVVHPYLAAQTIRNMLNMQTCFGGDCWFKEHGGDRLKYYFSLEPKRYPGTTYFYDSTGSFVLGALVEKVTGKTFLNYLREKCLDEIGWSKSARVLTAVGGYAWGDSALLCTSLDMLKFGRLLANGGEWNGKQLLSENAVTAALDTHIYNKTYGMQFRKQGYGYQIWGGPDGSFAFFGMHGQFTIYHPKTDILFVCTAGYPMEDIGQPELLFKFFFDKIVFKAENGEIENNSDHKELSDYINSLELLTVQGENYSEFAKKFNGRRFVAEKNPMNISEFTLTFNENEGEFKYINATGEKSIKFGMGKNLPQLFPETGYSKEIGGIGCEGHQYKCWTSAGWVEEDKLSILVQIIDDYIAILDITIGFNGDIAVIDMKKNAEYFLEEYNGYLTAKKA